MAEVTTQVLVESIVTLNQPAVKIDEIRAVVQSVRCIVIPNKVIFQGVIHKQIFFVRQDSLVAHQAEDVRFSGFVDVPGVTPDMTCSVSAVIEFIDFTLLDPTTLEQKIVLLVTIVTPVVVPTVSPTFMPTVSPTFMPTMFPTGTVPVTLTPDDRTLRANFETTADASGVSLAPNPQARTFFGTSGVTTVSNGRGMFTTMGTMLSRSSGKRVLG